MLCGVRTKMATRSYIFNWCGGSGPRPGPDIAQDRSWVTFFCGACSLSSLLQILRGVRTKVAARSYIFNWFGVQGRNLDSTQTPRADLLLRLSYPPGHLASRTAVGGSRARDIAQEHSREQSCSVPRAALASLLHILCLVRTKEAARSYIFKWFAGSGPKPEPGSALDCRGVP